MAKLTVFALFVFFGPPVALAQDNAAKGSLGDTRYSADYLDQGWTPEQTQWWYYLSQGTVFMPYEWLLALEQATGEEPFASPGHMSRLGFLIDRKDPQYNPDGLPVGFSKRAFRTGQGASCWDGNWVGFGCAACHTGQLEYRGHRIRIDGGAAHHDIEAFQSALGAALNATSTDPLKFQRFAGRVLASGAASDAEQLQKALQCFQQRRALAGAFFEKAQSQSAELSTAAGFGRLDAHERGVNLFLAAPLGEVRNYVPETAPVSFPHLWDTPYFDWVLYNASIRQPLARNVIEALGVQAPINHATILSDAVAHGVNMENVAAGQRLMMDLRAPAWPEETLGAIDPDMSARGRQIYADRCAGCHQLIDPDTHAGRDDASSGPGDAEITIATVPLEAIGTDPRQAATYERRTVSLEKLGGPASIASRDAAQIVTDKIVRQWIAESDANAMLAEEVNQGRPNEFIAPLAYRARPLDGIWATAPFLHNGSVPNLHQLLLPPTQRPKQFFTGSWEFDPDTVGYEHASPFPGAFLFDTRLPGNSNLGHDYGTQLDEADRRSLIEYLKTL